MKKVFYVSLVFLVFFGITACDNEDFLRDPAPTDEISGEFVTPQLAAIGMYSAYRDWYGGSHDVATAKAVYLGADVMGRDLQVPDFNWYIFEHRWDVVTIPNARRNNFVWDLCYKLIFHANTLMYVVESNGGGLTADQIKSYKGQALTMRALAYYDLIRSFQFTYAKNPQLPGVPLDLSIADSDHKPRGTVEQVYNQMYEDLTEAISLLSANRESKFVVNENVAKGVFARVALEKRDYNKAAQMAAEARQGYPLMNQATYVAGFNDFNNGEWMWGFPFNSSENWGYASFYSFIDHDRTAGYKDIYVNSAFYDLFSTTDYRRSLIVTTSSSLASGKRYRTRKFRDTADLTGNMVLMRSSEMYLIEVEAKAHSDLPGAKNLLLQFQLQRDPNAVLSSAATVDAFVEEVLVERRKELYGELGVDYFDMKRHQKNMTRTGNAVWNVVGYSVGQTIPATSNLWNFLIPQDEIDFNDAIGPEDQNPLD